MCHASRTVHSPLVGGLRKIQGHARSQLHASKYDPETFQGVAMGGKERSKKEEVRRGCEEVTILPSAGQIK
jgi:hypothetical protein